jgi:hypothetical protein
LCVRGCGRAIERLREFVQLNLQQAEDWPI